VPSCIVEKLADEARRVSAQQLVRDVCEDVLLAITATTAIKSCPLEFKHTAHVLYAGVVARFGDAIPASFVGLVNFFFLRFFCPALAIPQGHGVWLNAAGKEEAVPRPVSRLLIHVSSLLQKAASMTTYKDGHMAAAFNAWLVQTAAPRVAKFCKKMSTVAIGADEVAAFEAATTAAADAAALRQQLDAAHAFVAQDVAALAVLARAAPGRVALPPPPSPSAK